jgi:RNase P subunit RPR2
MIAMIKKRVCKTCGKPIFTFNDWISYQEYQISGMCQVCQDTTFVLDQDEKVSTG